MFYVFDIYFIRLFSYRRYNALVGHQHSQMALDTISKNWRKFLIFRKRCYYLD